MRELKFFRAGSRSPAAVHAADDLVVLESEVRWVVHGPPAQLDRLAAALPPGRRTASDGSLRLAFINEVGRFAVPGLGVLELRSRKLSEREFDSLLADIARVAAALPFADHDGAGAAHTPETTADPALLYHAFVYLRQILSPAAPRSEQLQAAIAAIVAAPHERLVTDSRPAPFRAARAVSMKAIERAIARPDDWERHAPGEMPTPWQQVAGERTPRTIESSQVRSSRDTAENQFVKHFLEHARAILRELLRRAGSTLKPGSPFVARLRADGDVMLAALDLLLRAPLWKEVGPLRQVPHGSTVLQGRHAYAAVLRHDIRLRALARLGPLRELWRDLIAVKDVARLYELWCFLLVVEAITSRRGAPERALVEHNGAVAAKLPWGIEVRWPDGISARYNWTFSPGRASAAPHSTSVLMRPDICVVLPTGPTRGLFVFDAKFSHHKGRAQHADLHVMHTYRDALRLTCGSSEPLRVRSAWVLFPGTAAGFARYPAETGVCAALAGIGAIPLRPPATPGGADLAAVIDVLCEFIPRSSGP